MVLRKSAYPIIAGCAMNKIFRRFALALALVSLAGCSPSGGGTPAQPPLAGAGVGGPFTLINQNGKPTSDVDFTGQYRIMYFGYTYCPDVCPVDVQHIGAALKLLEKSHPALAGRITPIFVTVDPERDTPAVLKEFVAAFHPRMVGLTGTPEQIADIAKKFAIFYEKQPPAPGGGYIVGHSRQAYLFDPAGHPLALLPQDKSPQTIADEIRRWAR